jgi:hypothetical protein
MVQEAKSPVKNLVRMRCAEGFNSGVKRLSYECISQTIYNILLCEMFDFCIRADEVSALLGCGDASVDCGTIVYVRNPYPIPVTLWYIPEEWRAGSVWRLEGIVKYQYIALLSDCLVTVKYFTICDSSKMV